MTRLLVKYVKTLQVRFFWRSTRQGYYLQDANALDEIPRVQHQYTPIIQFVAISTPNSVDLTLFKGWVVDMAEHLNRILGGA